MCQTIRGYLNHDDAKMYTEISLDSLSSTANPDASHTDAQ